MWVRRGLRGYQLGDRIDSVSYLGAMAGSIHLNMHACMRIYRSCSNGRGCISSLESIAYLHRSKKRLNAWWVAFQLNKSDRNKYRERKDMYIHAD